MQKFRQEHSLDLALVTEIVDRNDEEVVMKASIQSLDGQVIATGYAEEKRNASSINRTSALENAETSAIGRALAAFGLGGSEYATADEVASAIGHQASSQAPSTGIPDGPSEKQVDLIRSLSRDLGIREDIFEQRISLLASKSAASAAIEKLQDAIKSKGGDQ